MDVESGNDGEGGIKEEMVTVSMARGFDMYLYGLHLDVCVCVYARVSFISFRKPTTVGSVQTHFEYHRHTCMYEA